jgi:hypothetical protein
MVTRDRDGGWATQIQWQRAILRARCGSREQGMRWIERWMEKRRGLPGSGHRKAVRTPPWMVAAQAMVSFGPQASSGHLGRDNSRRGVVQRERHWAGPGTGAARSL